MSGLGESFINAGKQIDELLERNAKLVAALEALYGLAHNCNEIRNDCKVMRDVREAFANQQSTEKP